MKVLVSRNPYANTLSVKALEGRSKGRVVAEVEKIQMAEVEVTVAGCVGEPRAVWGAELAKDLDNETLVGLAIGKSFMPGAGVVFSPGGSKALTRPKLRLLAA